MPGILVVDDDDIVRVAISRCVAGMGFEVAQARNGLEGLAVLADCRFDLVILDMMMPIMDGPTMLAQLRERGDGTPVLMLTAESRRPAVASAMKCGIADYVMKPFQPEELRRKVRHATRGEGCEAPASAEPAPQEAPDAHPQYRPLVDVLVVDDQENVHKHLRSLLPGQVTLDGVTSARSALARARERIYRVVLVDSEFPDVDSAALARQLKELQPNAVVAALAVPPDEAEESSRLEAQGFGIVLYKPFEPAEVDDFVARYLERRDFVRREGNVLKLAAFPTQPALRDGYFSRLAPHLAAGLKEVAGASFREAIVDVAEISAKDDLLPKLLAATAAKAKVRRVKLLVVGPAEVGEALAAYEETRSIPCFATIGDARAGRATNARPPR